MNFLEGFRCLNASDDIVPFPWQERLYYEFCKGQIPRIVDIPTGLGKTKVMHIWLLALAAKNHVPRRLVYVVNRRVVVDQASSEAGRIEEQIIDKQAFSENSLFSEGIAVSKLRGQHRDPGSWRVNPARPGIIIGTVDMIGSRLLFEGYGVSRRMRPLHAGILGVDTLIVLDEAHLVPAFKSLMDSLVDNPDLKGTESLPRPSLQLLALSATHTTSTNGKKFSLSQEDRKNPEIARRMDATKSLTIHLVEEKKLVDKMVSEASKIMDGNPQKCVIYCDRRKIAEKVKSKLEKHEKSEKRDTKVILFTGARRAHERKIADDELRCHGFLAGGTPKDNVFLVATSAGEVGVDLDANHAVMDMVAWERMVQRLGRVNRCGDGSAKIVVCDANEKSTPSGVRLKSVRELLEKLPCVEDGVFQAGPDALSQVSNAQPKLIRDATTTPPLHPELTWPLIEAWAMTELQEHTGRPEVHHWLYGWSESEKPQTRIIWRSYLPRRRNGKVESDEVETFFRHGRPHIREILETEASHAHEWLCKRAKALSKGENFPEEKKREVVAYVLTTRNELKKQLTLGELASSMTKKEKEDFKDSFKGAVLVVHSDLGGLSPEGLLSSDADGSVPTADRLGTGEHWPEIDFEIRRTRCAGTNFSAADEIWEDIDFEIQARDKKVEAYRFFEDFTEGEPSSWLSIILKDSQEGEDETPSLSSKLISLANHAADVEQEAWKIAKMLGLPKKYIDLLALAGQLHDEGKKARCWQEAMAAPLEGRPYAKTLRGNPRALAGYRHEFGSFLFAKNCPEVQAISNEEDRDLLLHLITAHHGNARPGISIRGCDEMPPSSLEDEGLEVALRYVRLQNRWGPWGLAWWEALLRSADQIASKKEAKRG